MYLTWFQPRKLSLFTHLTPPDFFQITQCPTSSSIRSADKAASKTEIGATLKQSTPPEGLVFEDVYTITKRLRAGSYGTVFCTRHISSSQELAVKILDRTKLKKKDDDAVFREVAVMKELIDVPGVIKLMDFFVSPEKFYVVQEWAEGGDVSRVASLANLDCKSQSRSLHIYSSYLNITHSKFIGL